LKEICKQIFDKLDKKADKWVMNKKNLQKAPWLKKSRLQFCLCFLAV
jgi:hypothetical protein